MNTRCTTHNFGRNRSIAKAALRIGVGAVAGLLFVTGLQAQKKNKKRSETRVPDSYSESQIEKALQSPLTLDDCIRIALRKNVNLEIARFDIEAAKADISGSYATFLPTFSIEAQQTKQSENRPIDPDEPDEITDLEFDNNALVASVEQTFITGGILKFSGDLRRDVNSPDRFGAAPEETENRGYTVEFTQPLLKDGWFMITKSATNLAKHEKRAQQYIYDDAALQTMLEVKRAYYEVLLQREIINSNTAAISRDSTLLSLSNSKFNASLATRRDVLSAEIQLAEDQAALIAAEAEYELSLDALKEVLGLPITDRIRVAQTTLEYSDVPLDQEKLIALALDNNPVIKSIEADVRQNELQRRIAKNQRLPSLDFNISYNGQNDKKITDQTEVNSNDFVLGLSLSYPLFDRKSSSDVKKASIALSQQQGKLSNVRRQTIQEVRKLVRITFSSVKELEVLAKNKEAANEKVNFATAMFNMGRASNLDITDAQQALLKSEIQYNRKLVDYHLQLAQLETLIGRSLADIQ